MKNLFILFVFALSIISCKNATETVEETAEEVVEDVQDAVASNYEGEAFEAKDVLSYDQLLEKMEGQDSLVNVQVRGKVDAVCQTKGCWMTIVSENEGQDTMFVKFKDYGFFMPLDLEGEVVMKGKAFREETPVDELRHYAEDNGDSPEEIAAITEPLVELKFLADGVILKEEE